MKDGGIFLRYVPIGINVDHYSLNINKGIRGREGLGVGDEFERVLNQALNTCHCPARFKDSKDVIRKR